MQLAEEASDAGFVLWSWMSLAPAAQAVVQVARRDSHSEMEANDI